MDYAIVEISGRQYTVMPNKTLEVDYLGEVSTFECDKVLLTASGNNVVVGTPYVKEKLVFDVVGEKKTKLRVATYHAKANTRRVKGSKAVKTQIRLQSDSNKKTK